jgi:hypothetical protein
MLNAIEAALYTLFANNSALTTLTGTRIHNPIAPPETAFPYLIFYLLRGGDQHRTPRRSAELVYMVMAFGQTRADAAAVMDAADNALLNDALNPTGWGVVALRPGEYVTPPVSPAAELAAGETFFRYGRHFHLTIAQASA